MGYDLKLRVWRGNEDGGELRDYTVEVDSRRFTVKVIGPPPSGGAVAGGMNSAGRPAPRRARGASADGAGSGSLVSPLQGTVLRVNVKKGDEVEAGAVVCARWVSRISPGRGA